MSTNQEIHSYTVLHYFFLANIFCFHLCCYTTIHAKKDISTQRHKQGHQYNATFTMTNRDHKHECRVTKHSLPIFTLHFPSQYFINYFFTPPTSPIFQPTDTIRRHQYKCPIHNNKKNLKPWVQGKEPLVSSFTLQFPANFVFKSHWYVTILATDDVSAHRHNQEVPIQMPHLQQHEEAENMKAW